MRLVLDASTVLAWIFERVAVEEAALANHLLDVFLDHEIWVLRLWRTEVANALLFAERREVMTSVRTHDFLERLTRLPVKTHEKSCSGTLTLRLRCNLLGVDTLPGRNAGHL